MKSLEIREQLKDSFSIALSHGDLGYMYKEQGQLDKATEQYNLSNASFQNAFCRPAVVKL
ncbi:MAG: hypothetical protein IPL50_20865 [Chitinophagaceae bacterium]|nr:hypothetical protein [Chitinophagaceae bacterium]